jgi:hypothetical protein
VRRPKPQTTRLAAIRKALASDDPLSGVREAIAEENKQQRVVVWAYACILETSSAGLTILFERFTPPEILKIERALAAIGAAQTAADLRTLRQAFENAVDAGSSREDASDGLHESAAGRAINRKYERQAQEMEARLLAYCAEHERELAAG